MRRILALAIFIVLMSVPTYAQAQFQTDVIVTSPNGLWTDSRAYTSLNAAVAAIGANERTVVIAAAQTVTNLTVPSNISLRFEKNGSITTGVQLTLNTKNISAPDRQIFYGAGDIDFAPGSVVRTAWFANFATAASLTSDDSITLVVSKQETITSNVALGNNVNLKFESPQSRLTVNNTFTVSNVGQIEAGDYQILAGAGTFTFRDGVDLNLKWFSMLRTAITWVGSTKATLVIPGTNVVDYNDTVPSNITLDFTRRRGILSISVGVVLTTNCPIVAPIVPIFSGLGSVAGYPIVPTIYPQWLGAVGDGTANDTTALQNSISLLPVKGSWTLPFGTYKITSAITVSNLSEVTMDFSGQINADSSNGVVFTNVINSTVKNLYISKVTRNWTDGFSGIILRGPFLRNSIDINRIYGYQYGVYVDALTGTGIGHLSIYPNLVIDNKYGIFIHEAGTGWANDNQIVGGHITLASATKLATTGSWGIYFDNFVTNIYQNWQILGTSLEYLHNGMKIDVGCYNFVIRTPRFDTVDHQVTTGATVAMDYTAGYGAYDPSLWTTTSQTRVPVIRNPAQYGSTDYRSVIYDDVYGGVTYQNFQHPEDRFQQGTDFANYAGMFSEDYLHPNHRQEWDNQFSSTAIPTTDTWRSWSIVWDRTSTDYSPIGFYAATSGTMDTLVGVTGDITIGTPVLTVSDATNLKIGQYVDVAGAIVGAVITERSGTSITLSSNASATVVGAAVTFHPATWKPLPPFFPTLMYTILGSEGVNYPEINTGGGSTISGIGWYNPLSPSTTRSYTLRDSLNLGNLGDYSYLTAGYHQEFKHGFEGAAAPTTGSYRGGTTFWNTNRVSGQPMGWVAQVGGTQGTLAPAITGTIVAGALSTMTVSSATQLLIGQYLSIDNSNVTCNGPTWVSIANIVGSVVTISPGIGCAAGIVGQSVTWRNITWSPMPNYP